MGGGQNVKLFDDKNKEKNNSHINAYSLFLILILLILSEDVLITLKNIMFNLQQKPPHNKSTVKKRNKPEEG